jgi:hypothetical protein
MLATSNAPEHQSTIKLLSKENTMRKKKDEDIKLTIELVPKTVWGSNLRAYLPAPTWTMLSREIRWQAGHCQICEAPHCSDCHEIWQYDDRQHIQKLIGLIALCHDCHRVKHINKAYADGEKDQAVAHLAKVNQWSKKKAVAYATHCLKLWEQRNRYEWRLDLSWLKTQSFDTEIEEGLIPEGLIPKTKRKRIYFD